MRFGMNNLSNIANASSIFYHVRRAVDIWAIGCIFAEMLRGDPIFPGTEEKGKRVLQTNQMKRITSVLGKPTARDWPDIVHCTHYPTVADWSGFDCDLFTRLSSAHSSPSPSSTMYSSPYDTLSSPKSPLSPSPSSPSAFTSLSATRMCQKVPLLRSNMRAFDLLIQMLHYDPTKRITAEKV